MAEDCQYPSDQHWLLGRTGCSGYPTALATRQETSAVVPELPDLTAERIVMLKANLRRHGCPTVSSCARIIGEILYPLVRKLPRQCAQGNISILSRELQNKCVSKRSRLSMQWLHAWNVLRITDHSYLKGDKTKRYFVNVTTVIWLLGFRSADGKWE